MTDRWEASTVDAGDHVHVIPLGDSIEHAETDDCICGTVTEPCQRDDGSIGWLISHSSLDGRERYEAAR